MKRHHRIHVALLETAEANYRAVQKPHLVNAAAVRLRRCSRHAYAAATARTAKLDLYESLSFVPGFVSTPAI